LRSVVDFKEVITPGMQREASSAIRIIRYGKEISVLPTSGQHGDTVALSETVAPEVQISDEPATAEPELILTPEEVLQ
jgi:hypothetical protein